MVELAQADRFRQHALPIFEIAARLTTLKKAGRAEWCGPCPVCGGRDRFAINIEKGLWNCRGCACGGDAIALVRHITGLGFAEACRELAAVPSLPPCPARAAARGTLSAPRATDSSRRAIAIWEASHAIRGTAAETYFRRRCLDIPPRIEEAIRFHPACPFGPGPRRPCMVALFVDIQTNEPRALNRTALTPEGEKLGRMYLGPKAGCCINLSPDDDVELGLTIGEGIETCLAALMLGFAPTWACGDANNITKFPVLSGIEALTILVDNDRAGFAAARACGERWVAPGREVLTVASPIAGEDIDDLRKGIAS
jgi:hypothetical protein